MDEEEFFVRLVNLIAQARRGKSVPLVELIAILENAVTPLVDEHLSGADY